MKSWVKSWVKPGWALERERRYIVMNPIGQPERATQNRVIALFRDELHYRYLGDWTDRGGNSNIEEELLTAWLTRCGCTPAQIGVAVHESSPILNICRSNRRRLPIWQ